MCRCVICSDYTFGCCTPLKYSHLHENWPLLLVGVMYIDLVLCLSSTGYSCVRALWTVRWILANQEVGVYKNKHVCAASRSFSRFISFYFKNTLKNLSSSTLCFPFFAVSFSFSLVHMRSGEVSGFDNEILDLSVCWDYQSTPHNSHLVPSKYHQYCSKPDFFRCLPWLATLFALTSNWTGT